MSVESQVIVLFEEGNPVPDLDDLETIDLDAAAYLATLSQRSSEVTDIDINEKEKAPVKRPMTPWLIAAVVALVIGVAFAVINQAAEDAPVATTPTTVADATPTTASPPTTAEQPATTIDAAKAAWEAIPPFLGGLAGHYRSLRFVPGFSFDAPVGWALLLDRPIDDVYGLSPSQGRQQTGGVYLFRFDDSTVNEQVDRLVKADRLEVSDLEAVEAGGAAGIRLLAASSELFTLKSWPGTQPWSLEPELGEYAIYILDVNGDTVMILGELAEGRQAIGDFANSIVWKDLD